MTTLTTNDIVINKLTQILSYLRQGARMGKRGRKRDRGLAAKGLPKEDLLPELPKTEDRYGCKYVSHIWGQYVYGQYVYG